MKTRKQIIEEYTSKGHILATFDDIKENGYIPSIGLRGTSKIYSKKVSLFFYLFRKQITSIRQWIGWLCLTKK